MERNYRVVKYIILFFSAALISACGPTLDEQRRAMKGTMESYLNTPYRYGGTSQNGIDCSAFTQKVYASAGVSIPRTTAEQFKAGKEVEDKDYLFGDLLFFDTSVKTEDHSCCLIPFFFFFGSSTKPSTPGHVGIYSESGEFYHASKSRGVTRDSLYDYYWEKTFLGARRILKEAAD